jgi:chromosome segregation ATPase
LANQKELAQQAARLLKEVRNDLAAVSQKEQDLRTKVEAAQRETESLRKQLADRIQEAQSLRKSDDSVALRTRIAELEKTLALADGERTALRAQIQTLKADAASNSGQAQMKAADLEAQQRRTAEAEAKLAEQLREAANVRRDLSNAKQDLESARAEATTLQRSFEALQGRWEAASTEVATLRTQAQRTTEVEGRLAKAETDLSAAQRRAEELQTSKTKAEADRDALKTKADGDARSRLAAEQETVGLRQEVERIRSAMDEQTKLFQQSQELWKTREKELLSRITTLGAGSTRTPDGVPVSDKLPLRTWQYANGISVQARFVLRSGPDIYVLEQADGTRVAVSRSSLSTDDQKYLDGVSPQK